MESTPRPTRTELCVRNAELVVTMDAERREIPGGWVAIDGGFVSAVGGPGREPPAERVIDASGCLVTPGLVNTHHHLYQNLTRAFAPALGGDLFEWLRTLYPVWSRLDEEAAYVSAWIGLCELALGGCTASTDHLYLHPRGAGDLIGAEIAAARELGFRFHPTRGSMSLSVKDGGLPPDDVVQEDDEILDDSERLVARHHDPAPGAMVRIALAPCSPFSVTPELMARTAELAERLDVRLHTHLAEDVGENAYCREAFGCRPVEHFERVGWGSDRAWVAHCVHPNLGRDRAAGALGDGRGALPELEPDPGCRPGARARVARRGRAGGHRLRRLRVGGLRVAVAGDARRAAAGAAARRGAGDAGARGTGAGDPGRRRLPGAR